MNGMEWAVAVVCGTLGIAVFLVLTNKWAKHVGLCRVLETPKKVNVNESKKAPGQDIFTTPVATSGTSVTPEPSIEAYETPSASPLTTTFSEKNGMDNDSEVNVVTITDIEDTLCGETVSNQKTLSKDTIDETLSETVFVQHKQHISGLRSRPVNPKFVEMHKQSVKSLYQQRPSISQMMNAAGGEQGLDQMFGLRGHFSSQRMIDQETVSSSNRMEDKDTPWSVPFIETVGEE